MVHGTCILTCLEDQKQFISYGEICFCPKICIFLSMDELRISSPYTPHTPSPLTHSHSTHLPHTSPLTNAHTQPSPTDKLDAVRMFRKRKRLHSEEDGNLGGELSLTEYLRRKKEEEETGRPKKRRVRTCMIQCV